MAGQNEQKFNFTFLSGVSRDCGYKKAGLGREAVYV